MATARIARGVVIAVAVTAAWVAAVVIAVLLALRTEPGMETLTRVLERSLSAPGEREVTIEAIEGNVLGRFEVRGLSVADASGTWLTSERVSVAWRPAALWRGRLHVSELEVSSLEVVRRPQAGTARVPDGPVAFRLPVHVGVERFRLARLRLGPALLGAPVSLEAQGESVATRAGTVRVSLTATGLEPAGLEAAVDAELAQPAGELTVHARLTEPGGEILGRALGRGALGDVSVRLEGAGPLAQWQGELTAAAPRLGTLAATLHAGLETPVRLGASARFDPGTDLAQPAAALSAGGAEVTVDLTLSEDGTTSIRRARLETAVLRASLTGRASRDVLALDAHLHLEEAATARLGAPLAPLALAAVDIDVALTGSPSRPRLALEARAPGTRVAGAGQADLRGSADLAFEHDSTLRAFAASIRASGELRDLILVDPRLAALVPGGRLTWEIAAHRRGKTLEIERARLAAANLRLEGAGSVVPAERSGELRLALEAEDLAPIGPLVGVGLGGRARAHARVRAPGDGAALQADIDGELAGLSVASAPIEAVLGTPVRFRGRLVRGAEREWRISDFGIESTHGRLTGNLALAPAGGRVTGDYRLVVDELAGVASALGARVGGRLVLEGVLEGPATDPDVEATAGITGLTVGEHALGDLSASLAARRIATDAQGEIDAALHHPDLETVELATAFEVLEGGDLALRGLRANARDSRLSGELRIVRDSGALRGALQGRSDALATWAPLLGRPVDGTASVNVTLVSEAGRQDASLEVRLEGLMTEGPGEAPLGAAAAEVSANLRDLWGAVGGDIEASAHDVATRELRLERLSVAARSGDAAAVAVDVDVLGDLRGELDLALAAELRRRDGTTRLRVRQLAGRAFGHDVALARGAEARLDGRAWAVRDLALDVEGGTLALDAESSAERLAASLNLIRVPLSLLRAAAPQAQVTGTVSGSLDVDGTRAAPRGRFALDVDGLRETGTVAERLPPLQARLRGRWEKGRLLLDGSLAGVAAADLRFEGSAPLRLARDGAGLEVPAAGNLAGSVSWAGAIGPYWDLLGRGEDVLRGDARLDLRVSGTVGAPRLEGEIALLGGRYEHARTGALLEAIELRVRSDADRVVIRRAEATDGDGGTLRATGSLALDPQRGMPVDLEATMQGFSLLRRDEITATASGELALSGPLQRPVLTGTVVTDRVDAIVAGRRLPASVVELDVEEVNRPEGASAREKRSPAGRGAELGLDLGVQAPGNVFLRGRGLDSEWRGGLRVTGTTSAPILEGELEPVRGRYLFAGKAFRLGAGSVRFPGGSQLQPILDLSAVHRAADIEAIIQVTGRATQPDVALESRPPMPDSEIVARVLFGKGSGELTPAQSVQLASAVASLSGATGDIDLLERTRAALGVDSVQVGDSSTGNGEAAVSVGKYVAPNVYLEFERGVQTGANAAEVEVEVLPNVRLESGVTDQQEGKVGVHWRWDY